MQRRLAEVSDLDAVYTIYMEPSVVRYLGHDPMPLERFRSLYRELLASACLYVYPVDGLVAGFYKASRHPGRAAHVAVLGTLALAPDYQGRGIARAMIVEALDALRTEGARRIELTVESDNPKAIGFYERLGFEHEGTLRQFYKRAGEEAYVDDHIMALLLK
jgi:putative acetyltransferase